MRLVNKKKITTPELFNADIIYNVQIQLAIVGF